VLVVECCCDSNLPYNDKVMAYDRKYNKVLFVRKNSNISGELGEKQLKSRWLTASCFSKGFCKFFTTCDCFSRNCSEQKNWQFLSRKELFFEQAKQRIFDRHFCFLFLLFLSSLPSHSSSAFQAHLLQL
jgi:hypothetical protein